MQVEVSNGELVDKYTILQIKTERINCPEKVRNVIAEKSILEPLVRQIIDMNSDMFNSLLSVNKSLWDIEDKIREKERNKQFDDEFIELARLVYITNDNRSKIKREINEFTNSDIIEEKSYETY